MTLITFTSDFGLRDVYVGVVHGVIAAIAPQARLIDLTHLIPPQDVVAGAVALYAACRTFPEGTIHLAVVDPGVGTTRRALLLRTDQSWFIGPDNGLFTLAAPTEAILGCWELTNPRYWLPSPSATFHGRDIFGPAAAHLANGVPAEDLGTPTHPPHQLPGLLLRDVGSAETVGTVLAIDHFGNMITNLRATREWAEGMRANRIAAWLEEWPLRAVETYGNPPIGAPSGAPTDLLLLTGSAGLLEIAVVRGDAAAVSGVGVGARLRVKVIRNARG